MKLLLKAVHIIDPGGKLHKQTKDIFIEKGKIVKIGDKLNFNADKTVSIENLHVSKGWFDSSISFGEPGFEERETLDNGLRVAAKSGFTAIALNANTKPVPDNSSAISFFRNKSGLHGVGLYPKGALSLDAKGKDLAELFDMSKAGAVAFSDYKKPVSNPNLLKIALQYAQGFDALVASYPQENAIATNGLVHEDTMSTHLGLKGIPALAEELQIARDLFILEYTGGKLHIPTISSKKSVQLIKEAKVKGLDVSCSVAIANLLFTDKELRDFDSKFKVLPPLREKEDMLALREGLKSGVIDMLTCDHMPRTIDEKKVEFENAAFGSIGLESAFAALRKIFDIETSIQFLTAGKARFKIPTYAIAENQPAELSFFLPNAEYNYQTDALLSTSKNSIFTDTVLKGKTVGIFANQKLSLF